MITARRLVVSVLIFIVAALMGPLIRWITWPPSKFERDTSTSMNNFVSDLVFSLWPTQPLAVMEASTGAFVAGLVAVSANVILFGFVGAVVGAIASQRFRVTVSLRCDRNSDPPPRTLGGRL